MSAQRPHTPASGPPQLWPAAWIRHPESAAQPVGVTHFRRALSLTAVPPSFRVRVTADMRYLLYVNGSLASMGPARSDLDHWRYEVVDLARFLTPGRNVLAAVTWFWGDLAAWPQMGSSPGFLLCGNEEAANAANTPNGWVCYRNPSHSPLPPNNSEMPYGVVTGACERIDGISYPWGWERLDFDDSAWVAAQRLAPGSPRGARDAPSRYQLVPRPIPPMELTGAPIGAIVRTEGIDIPNHRFSPDSPVTIPAGCKVKLLIDHGKLTCGYPSLIVGGGRGAIIRLRYAEALFKGREKGSRNEIEGKRLAGMFDEFVADGATSRRFRPLWYRTFRYLQLEVETAGEPVTLQNLEFEFTGYPFKESGRFDSSDESLKRIWATGVWTQRLCAEETYMDCPYYERLQYGGDTRIQCLVSYYTFGDDRLARNAIDQLDYSRIPDGLTQSRYPSRTPQMIPPFSLWWINMIHDYWMFRGEDAYVQGLLPGTRGVLAWWESRIDQNGLLGPLPWWNFVDWSRAFPAGVPPGVQEGGSSILSLQLILALRAAAEMEDTLGHRADSERYRASVKRIQEAVRARCWDERRGLLADSPAKDKFSQHANVLGILTDTLSGERARAAGDRLLAGEGLAQATYYFRFYLHRALRKVGKGDEYLQWLEPWRTMLSLGLTTWAEEPEPTRSDCHAWSSHPNVDLLATVVGIEPAAPGFAKVRIEPRLGPLEWVEGVVPHPRGEVRARFERAAGRIHGTVTLPEGVSGSLRLNGRDSALRSGTQQVG